MPPVVTACFDPVYAEPATFVNRVASVASFSQDIEGAILRATTAPARFVVTGAKGVGKTIFTRHVLRDLHEHLQTDFVLVEVDGRGLLLRTFLERFARNLVREGVTAPRAVDTRLHPWLRQLGNMATSETITTTASEIATTAATATAGGSGSLFGALELTGSLQWVESRNIGASTTRTARVDERALADALGRTLEVLRRHGHPVVVFLNDLDQAVDRENPEQARQALGRLVEIEDCVQVLNVRTEVLYDDLRREARVISLSELPADELLRVYEARAAREPDANKRAALLAPGARTLALRLAKVNGNPFAFLTWLDRILRSYGPENFDLDDEEQRVALVTRLTGLPDTGLLARAARAMDERSSAWDGWCTDDDLLVGRNALTRPEIDDLRRKGILVPRDVFVPSAGLRLEAIQDLARPSVRERLR